MKNFCAGIFFSAIAVSCETETEIVKNMTKDSLTSENTLVSQLKRLSQSPTAIDNTIDNTSCFALRFPVHVSINGQNILIDSVDDYAQVDDILNADVNDMDSVLIYFPVSVIFPDYTKTVVQTQSLFNNLSDNCDASIELSCISLQYPVSINAYKEEKHSMLNIDLTSNYALSNFLKQLNEYDAVTFTFPLYLIAPNGTSIAINNNTELSSAIDSYTDECDAAFSNRNLNKDQP